MCNMFRSMWLVFILAIATGTLPAAAQTLIATVPVGNDPIGVEANPVTNLVYVANNCGADPNCGTNSPGTVTVINGATNAVVATVTVGIRSGLVAINSVTNKIYVSNCLGNSVSVIDGATNHVTTTVPVGNCPYGADVDTVTNKIYVANINDGTVKVIDGNTDTVTASVPVGGVPQGVSVNPITNKVYVGNFCGADPNCLNDGGAMGTVTVIDGATNNTTSVTVGVGPAVVLVDKVTNKIGVQNTCGSSLSCIASGNGGTPGSISIIDGATLAVTTIATGNGSAALAVNPVANKFYITNNADNTVMIIDESSHAVSTVGVGAAPDDVEVNPDTNKIYVADNGANTVTVVDGETLGTTTVGVGAGPVQGWVNPVSNRYYVTDVGDNTVSVLGGAPADAVQFVPLTPCRVVDTRNPNGPFGGPPIAGGTYRTFALPSGDCNIPSNATGYSVNVTLIPPSHNPIGYLTIWPTGEIQPTVSTMNSLDARIKANAAIVPAGSTGSVNVYLSNTANIAIDVNGYFTAPAGDTLQFYPLTPCRMIDTRNANGNLGGPFLTGGVVRDFPLSQSSCIPQGANIQAYSLNFTVVPHPSGTQLSYLTVWPAGQTQPVVSTLNNLTATIVANAAIVPAGTAGSIAVYPTNDTDLVVDVNGYFAAPGTGGLSLYSTAPCRVLDTRQGHGAFNGELTVDVVDSVCAPPSTAKAYVLNATVVPGGSFGYLTLWPDGEPQPLVSTLDAIDGAITSNMAIVPTTNGSIDAYASGLTQLVLDISSYFAP
jgi:YVTN family beta-propeller protein